MASPATSGHERPRVAVGALGLACSLLGVAILMAGRLLQASATLNDYAGGVLAGIGFTLCFAGLTSVLVATLVLERSVRHRLEISSLPPLKAG